MKLFVLTNACTSRAHCATCRDKEGGRAWRTLLASAFALPDDAPDFACPHGLNWGDAPIAPTPPPPAPPGPRPQTVRTGTRARSGNCGGCGRNRS